MARQSNDGNGNATAARGLIAAPRRFVRSGRVDEAARAAEAAVPGPDSEALRAAEEKGRPKYGSVTRKPPAR